MPTSPLGLVPAAYRPVLANRVFRRLTLGFGVSYLGDGMSFVAVAWLAIELAPPGTAGLWVGGAAGHRAWRPARHGPGPEPHP